MDNLSCPGSWHAAELIIADWLAYFQVFSLLTEVCKGLMPLSLQVTTARLRARVVWAIAEHFDLEGLDPLLADDPEDPLTIMIDHIHKILFNLDSSATSTNRFVNFIRGKSVALFNFQLKE